VVLELADEPFAAHLDLEHDRGAGLAIDHVCA
jgi:hypothetical protein